MIKELNTPQSGSAAAVPMQGLAEWLDEAMRLVDRHGIARWHAGVVDGRRGGRAKFADDQSFDAREALREHLTKLVEEALKPKAAVPLRMLTEKEMLDEIGAPQTKPRTVNGGFGSGDYTVDEVWPASLKWCYEAVQRKFCEVNGLSIGATLPATPDKGAEFRAWQEHPLFKSASAMTHFDAGWMAHQFPRCAAPPSQQVEAAQAPSELPQADAEQCPHGIMARIPRVVGTKYFEEATVRAVLASRPPADTQDSESKPTVLQQIFLDEVGRNIKRLETEVAYQKDLAARYLGWYQDAAARQGKGGAS